MIFQKSVMCSFDDNLAIKMAITNGSRKTNFPFWIYNSDITNSSSSLSL